MKNSCRYLVTVAYDGSNFWGWAKQPGQLTGQGYIENTLQEIFSFSIRVFASGRTDKGVHAREQKFTFLLPFFLTNKKLFSILKKRLEEYFLVKNVERVNSNFHPLYNVVSKEYRYFINVGKPNIWQKKYCWDYNLPLETTKLNNILQLFCGQHDFFNYCRCRYRDREKTETVRRIDSVKSWRRKNRVIISIVAPGFLRYQIRAIVGEAISCYEGKQTIFDLKRRLIAGDKYKNLAPPSGLYLWKTKVLKKSKC